MKNVFLIAIAPLFLLASCQPSSSSSLRYAAELENDKATLKSKTDNCEYFSAETSFSSRLGYSLTESGKYLYTFEISGSSKTENKVKALLYADVKGNDAFFFFGYDSDYTLLEKSLDADRVNKKVLYLFINFSLSMKLDTVYVLYQSDAQTLNYKLDPIDLNA